MKREKRIVELLESIDKRLANVEDQAQKLSEGAALPLAQMPQIAASMVSAFRPGGNSAG